MNIKKIQFKVPEPVKRTLYVVSAFAMVVTSVMSGMIEHAYADLILTRRITISQSASDANNVAYKVEFTTPAVGSSPAGVVVDFCSNNPIIGDNCNAPIGFNVNESSITIATQTGITGLSLDAATTVNSLRLTKASGTAVAASTAVTLELGNGTTTGFHNPTAVGSFYARIYTYGTQSAAQGHSIDTPSGYIDYGGIALSTARVINITAKVQETLSFCVYKTGGVCGGTDPLVDVPTFTIGHTSGTATIIDANNIDTSDVNFSVSTNANSGVKIRLKGDTLKAGSNDINAAGVSQTFAAGTEAFGLRMSTLGSGVTATTPYGGAAGIYSLVTSGAGTNDITTTYGGEIASLAAPTSTVVSTITYAATASNTTPAGTYTAIHQLIATGTF